MVTSPEWVMTDDQLDPIEWLRHRDPADELDDEATDETLAQELDEALRRGQSSDSRPDIDPLGAARRRRTTARVSAAVVAAATVGGSTLAWTKRPTVEAKDKTLFLCFAEPRLDADRVLISLDGRTPAQRCRFEFEESRFSNRPKPDRYAACVLSDGRVGVFPDLAKGDCPSLDLLAADGSTDGARGVLTELIDQTGRAVAFERCLSTQAAENAVLDVLEDLDLADWTVETFILTTPKTCAVRVVDDEAQIVTLTALPR
jgi:hypothetical protein